VIWGGESCCAVHVVLHAHRGVNVDMGIAIQASENWNLTVGMVYNGDRGRAGDDGKTRR